MNRRKFVTMAPLVAGVAATSASSAGLGWSAQTDIAAASEAQPQWNPAFLEDVRRMTADPAFKQAWETIDMQRFADAFNAFSDRITTYNTFHTRERRLWAVKMQTGRAPANLERALQAAVPQAVKDYTQAFEAIETCMTLLEESGFTAILNTYMDTITKTHLFDEQYAFGRSISSYFQSIGCSRPMIDEFKAAYQSTNYELIKVVGSGNFANLRQTTREGVQAQVQLMEYTREQGLSYLRGRCGPPAWAVAVSEILGFAGISVSAWVVVVIIAALVAILISICLSGILPPDIQSKCDYVKFKLKLSF